MMKIRQWLNKPWVTTNFYRLMLGVFVGAAMVDVVAGAIHGDKVLIALLIVLGVALAMSALGALATWILAKDDNKPGRRRGETHMRQWVLSTGGQVADFMTDDRGNVLLGLPALSTGQQRSVLGVSSNVAAVSLSSGGDTCVAYDRKGRPLTRTKITLGWWHLEGPPPPYPMSQGDPPC